MFAGIMARPLATSLRTNSGVISLGMEAPNPSPHLVIKRVPYMVRRCLERLASDCNFIFSRIAINSISGVTIPSLAYCNWVTTLPFFARSIERLARSKSGNSLVFELLRSACVDDK